MTKFAFAFDFRAILAAVVMAAVLASSGGGGVGVSAQSRASCRRKQKACRLGNDTLAFQACLDYTVKKGCTSLCKKEKNKQKRKQCEKLAKRVLKRGTYA